ncbi:hypothetical protein Tco_0844016 [Tanacetum coccineum]
MTLKYFLHFSGNHLPSFSARPADVPMLVGSYAGSVANVPDEELKMVVVAPVANNVVGAKVVPPFMGRRWRGVFSRLVGSPWRVIAPSLNVYSKGKRVAFPNSAGSPSFKKRKHVVLDEGPSSPKSVPDIAPSDEACKTLFGSLASTEERTSLVRDFFPHAVERLLSSDHLSSALADLQEKAMLVGRSQALREVASSGIGVELVDMMDFDPNAKQNYDRAIESFYQVKFPYADHLVHYAGQSVGKLMTLKPPIILFGNASAAGPSAIPFL